MLLVLEIAMSVFGIITLTKGRISLSRDKVVTGVPAYVIGGLLTACFPVILFLGFCLGIYLGAEAALHHRPAPTAMDFIWLDVGVVVILPLICLFIALASAKPPESERSDEYYGDLTEIPPEPRQSDATAGGASQGDLKQF